MQELKARLAPVLARWQNKLLAQTLEAFRSNAAASSSKRIQVQRALHFWNNRALVSAFAQWVDSVQVREELMHLLKCSHPAKGSSSIHACPCSAIGRQCALHTSAVGKSALHWQNTKVAFNDRLYKLSKPALSCVLATQQTREEQVYPFWRSMFS